MKNFLFRYGKSDGLKKRQNPDIGGEKWIQVTIPDYRGPVGRWFGYYYTSFNASKELFKLGRQQQRKLLTHFSFITLCIFPRIFWYNLYLLLSEETFHTFV